MNKIISKSGAYQNKDPHLSLRGGNELSFSPILCSIIGQILNMSLNLDTIDLVRFKCGIVIYKIIKSVESEARFVPP